MMIIDGYKITAFTKLREELCLRVLNIVQREFGEIGYPLIEDDCISFEVYRDYFKDAPLVIEHKGVILRLIDKFDNLFFTLCYEIIPNGITNSCRLMQIHNR